MSKLCWSIWYQRNGDYKYKAGIHFWLSSSHLVSPTLTGCSLDCVIVLCCQGGRYGQMFTGTSNRYWLFGGLGFDSTGGLATLDDVWSFNVETNIWTWVAGSSIAGSAIAHGTSGAFSASYTPGTYYDHYCVSHLIASLQGTMNDIM
jgi:hypothetical protein